MIWVKRTRLEYLFSATADVTSGYYKVFSVGKRSDIQYYCCFIRVSSDRRKTEKKEPISFYKHDHFKDQASAKRTLVADAQRHHLNANR